MAISSRAIKAGEAFVSMMLDDEQFANSIDDWKTKFSQLEKRVAPLGQAMAGIGASMTAPFVLGVRHLQTYTKQLGLTAERLGMTGSQFSQLAAVARLTDVSIEGLEIGMKTIGERIMQLQSSSAETAQAFEQLGIDANAFINEPNTLRRLFMIADAFTKIEDAGLQGGLALRALGESGNRMLPMLRKGSRGIQQEMQDLAGITADASQIAAAGQLFQSMTRLRLAAGNLAGEMAETVVPSIVRFADATTSAVASITSFVKQNPGMVSAVGHLAVAISSVGTALLSLKAASFLTVQGLSAMKGAVDLLAFSLRNLIPLLITTEIHISGIGVALTPLAGLLAAGTAGLAAFQYFSGMRNPFKALAAWATWFQRAVLNLVDAIGLLPESIRSAAQAFDRWLFDIPELASATQGPAIERAGAAGAAPATSMSTSGIAARFASQQTLGFSAGAADNSATIASNTTTMVGQLEEIKRQQRDGATLK